MKSANKRTSMPALTNTELSELSDQLIEAYDDARSRGMDRWFEVARRAAQHFAARGCAEPQAVDTATTRVPAETLKKALDAVGLFLEYAEKNAVLNGDGRVYYHDGEVFRIMLNTARNLLEIINDYPA